MTEAALTDLLTEIAGMREKPVPASEFEDAKRAIQASFALSLENPAPMLSYYVQSWTYDLPANYWDTYPARIAAVGDAPAVSEILAKHGTLEVFDADGKPLPSGPGR